MRVIRSFSYAWQGIVACLKRERNYKIQVCFFLLVLCMGLYLNLPGSEWITIFFCSALTLSLEMMNSAIEKLADHVSPSLHPAIKQVKDIAAGAVLISAIINSVIASIIFIPHIIHNS